VEIVNLQPPAIIAAWQRGDIDGAYVWAPAVNALEKDGKVLTDSSQVGEWGAPTLDVWVVRKDFAEKHPEVVKALPKALSMRSNLISLIPMTAEAAGEYQQIVAFKRRAGSGCAGTGER
jgi:taurine ABC transporter substrate-binding protein